MDNLFQSEPGVEAVEPLLPGTYYSNEEMAQSAAGTRGPGLAFILDLPESAGEGTVQVTIEAKDRFTGRFYPLLQSAPRPKGTLTRLIVHAQLPAVAGLVAQAPITDTWRIAITVAYAPMLGTVSWETV